MSAISAGVSGQRRGDALARAGEEVDLEKRERLAAEPQPSSDVGEREKETGEAKVSVSRVRRGRRDGHHQVASDEIGGVPLPVDAEVETLDQEDEEEALFDTVT